MQNAQNTQATFDFEAWATLAKDSPAAFDEIKKQYLEDVILRYCGNHEMDQRKMRGLQWRIDMEISKAHTPLKACLRLSSMMWDSFLEMRDELDQLTEECRKSRIKVVSSDPPAKLNSALAQVIPFSKRLKPP